MTGPISDCLRLRFVRIEGDHELIDYFQSRRFTISCCAADTRFRDWKIGDHIVFFSGSELDKRAITGLAEISGEVETLMLGQKKEEKLLFGVPLNITHILLPEHYLQVFPQIHNFLVTEWRELCYIRMHNYRLLSGSTAEAIINMVRSQPNDLAQIEKQYEQYLKIANKEVTYNEIEKIEYAIYSTILNKYPRDVILAIRDITRKPFDFSFVSFLSFQKIIESFEHKSNIKLDSDLMIDFMNKNKHTYNLSNNFWLRNQIDIWPNNLIDNIYDYSTSKKYSSLGNFLKKYPFGIDSFSRVGFNKRKDQALIYHDSIVDPLAGYGEIVLLVKEDAAWKIRETMPMWIS